MVIVTGRICVDPADVEELLADLRAGIDRSLQEDGCSFYTFAMEDKAAGHILTLQIWRDEQALAKHLAVPDLVSMVEKWSGRFDVQTKFMDVSDVRDVGVWRDPEAQKIVDQGVQKGIRP